MFKTFTAAVLAAVASAANEGNNYANKVMYHLIPDKLHLNLYNARNGDVNELHGELIWTDGAEDFNTKEMGFCVRKTDETTWDCMRTRFSTDTAAWTENPAEAKQFDITDTFSTTDLLGVTRDDTWTTKINAGVSWRAVDSKSSKTCVASTVEATKSTKSTCSNATSHWYRNFITSDGTQDIQLSGATSEEAAVVYKAIGWMSTWSDITFANGTIET